MQMKRRKNKLKTIILILSILFMCTNCNATQSNDSQNEDCNCKKVKIPNINHSIKTYDSLSNLSYPINLKPTKDSSLIGIWFDYKLDGLSSFKILYSCDYKLYAKTLFVSFFGFEDTTDYTVYDQHTDELVLTKKFNKFILIDKYLYDKKNFTNSYYYISRKDSILICDVLSLDVKHTYRKINSINQPLAEQASYIEYCRIADSNTIGWFPGGGVMCRFYKKYDKYYCMFISASGWECLSLRYEKLANGNMHFEGGPFGIYYEITADKSVMNQYSSSGDLISSDKCDVNYNYLDYPTYYLFHTIYGYDGVFIPDLRY